jgi:hypothetical protein
MYKLTNGNIVIKFDKGFTMPIQPGDEGLNSNWDEYQVWLKAGNKPLPADATSVWDTPRDLAQEIDDLKARIEKLERVK